MTSPFNARTHSNQANLLPEEQIGVIELKGGVLDFGKLAKVICQQTCGLSEAFGFHSI
jgi:hypothetical protein